MINITIKEYAEKQGVETAYQLQKLLGIQPSVASDLWKGNLSKIGINTLNRLCKAWNCQPDKLLRYEPDIEDEGEELTLAAKNKKKKAR